MTAILEYGWLGVTALLLGVSCLVIAGMRLRNWWRDGL